VPRKKKRKKRKKKKEREKKRKKLERVSGGRGKEGICARLHLHVHDMFVLRAESYYPLFWEHDSTSRKG